MVAICPLLGAERKHLLATSISEFDCQLNYTFPALGRYSSPARNVSVFNAEVPRKTALLSANLQIVVPLTVNISIAHTTRRNKWALSIFSR